MRAWLCRIVGHRLEREPDTKAEGAWWYENYKCSRCGALLRTLVASREG